MSRFKIANPDLYAYLSGLETPALVERVADAFKDSFGVTKKFADFVLKFRPPEPEQRPAWRTMAIDWSDASLKRILRIVYAYRSKALHEGRPFPAPMCDPAHNPKDWPAPAKKPSGSASMSGGTWFDEDLPILLQTFEYIARHTLLNWWRSQTPREDQS